MVDTNANKTVAIDPSYHWRSKGQIGKKLSDETRRNISRAKLGRSIVQPKDDASRKRRSDAVKRSWLARKLSKHTEDNHGN